MGKFRGPLTAEQALQGIDCCLENAEALIEDAQVLLDNGRPARCAALCLVAAEELGKIPMLANCASHGQDRRRWQSFWRRFRSHLSKLSMGDTVFASEVIEPDLAAIGTGPFAAEYGDAARLREASLYVDWVDGGFVAPADVAAVTGLASALLSELRHALEFHRSMREHLTADSLKTVGVPDWMNAWLRDAARSKGKRGVRPGDHDDVAALKDYRRKMREIGREVRRRWERRKGGPAAPTE